MLSVKQILLSVKLSGDFFKSHWKTGLRMLSNDIQGSHIVGYVNVTLVWKMLP